MTGIRIPLRQPFFLWRSKYMFYPFCKGSISFHEKLRKEAFLHYIQFFKMRRCNDYAFSKNAAAFYQKSALSAEIGLIKNLC
jgi:hypothetical protein